MSVTVGTLFPSPAQAKGSAPECDGEVSKDESAISTFNDPPKQVGFESWVAQDYECSVDGTAAKSLIVSSTMPTRAAVISLITIHRSVK